MCQNLCLKVFGDNEIETRVIDSLEYKKTHNEYLLLSSEIVSIQNKLFYLGYIENKASKIEKENDSTFRVKISLKKKYDTIYIYYKKNTIDEALINKVSKQVFPEYFVLPIGHVESALIILNEKVSDKGFPFSKLSLSNIEVTPNNIIKANLVLAQKEQQRHINDIKIKGYDNFPKSYLKHYLKIKPHQILDLNTVKRKAEQLSALRFAQQIKPPEVLFTKDSTILYMYIKKTKSNTFDGFLGFGTNETTNKIDFNGYLNLNLINNLNYGESFSLQYKSTQNNQKYFQADVSMPYILATPIGIDLQLYIYKQDSSFSTVNQSIKLNYQINTKHKLYTGIKTTESNDLLNNNPSQTISDYTSNYLTLAYQYINPQFDNLLFPINSNIYLETSFGKRKSSNTSEKQTQLNIEVSKIFNLNQTNSIYLRFKGNTLISNTFLENELSRFGGINSIRGFQENSIEATSYGFFNTEYRLQLSSTIYAHSIIDIASFENKIIGTKEKLFSYGLGLGILSNAGLLKLDYANGKTENQKFKFSNSQIHMSLTANF